MIENRARRSLSTLRIQNVFFDMLFSTRKNNDPLFLPAIAQQFLIEWSGKL
jgi:hypothetical protein